MATIQNYLKGVVRYYDLAPAGERSRYEHIAPREYGSRGFNLVPAFGYGGGGYGGGGYGGHRDSGPSGPMVEGKVKFFNDQKGFGFVMPDSGSGDIYLHASALRRSGVQAVEPDQRIRYSTRQGNKGVEVDRVEII